MNLPTKTVTGQTLEDRLTQSAYNQILPARYLKKDEDGNVTESPEELFERVAKNIAVAEAIYTDDTVTITEEDIKPEHPRKEELTEEVFSENVDDAIQRTEVELNEDNAKWVSYDKLRAKCEENGWHDTLDTLEETKRSFHDAMSYLDFMPNSPTLMNAGDELQQLSACFVDSPEDDIRDIHDTAREAAEVFQSGGGMGYAFWRLRPYGDQVGSTGGIASGPITFMRTFDQMCRTIAQGGTRRGAQMGIMRISHPDVIQFIHAKNKDVSLAHQLRLNDPKDFTHTSFKEALGEAREFLDSYDKIPKHLRNAVEGHLANFNISVGLTKDFMRALKNGNEYTFTNPRTGEPHIVTAETAELYETYELGEYVDVGEELSVPAEEIWERIIDGAYENGEPGVVFLDRINEKHSFPTESTPTEEAGEYEVLATNPCGEQPLMEYEACNLGHINLSTVISNDAPLLKDIESSDTDTQKRVSKLLHSAIDWEDLDRRIELGTRFLDNVVTMSAFPIDKISESVKKNRKVGLGIMGLAEMFIQIGVEYGTNVGNEVARQLMVYINHRSKEVSSTLADERGVFENWEDSKYANPTEYKEWFEHHTGHNASEYEDGFEIRNHNTTTIAPTGTTSMIGNTSGGCEPIPNVVFFKNVGQDVQGQDMLVEMNDYFRRTLEANDIDADNVKSEAASQMQQNEFDGVEGLSEVPDEIASLFVTTDELSGIEHGAVQCACQKGIDSAISKTVNAPNDATKEDTDEAFRYVYNNGGKGITYYRDGTRSKQVITTRAQNKEFADEDDLQEFLHDAVEEYGASKVADEIRDIAETDDLLVAGTTKTEQRQKPKPRPQVTKGETHRIETGYGTMYVTINEDENGLHEVFGTVGKSGGFTESMVEALCREISLALRVGADVDEVIDQIEDIRSPRPSWDNGEQIQSIPDGIATALDRYKDVDEITASANTESKTVASSDGGQVQQIIDQGENPECPDCGSMLNFSEGCKECSSCGWSKC